MGFKVFCLILIFAATPALAAFSISPAGCDKTWKPPCVVLSHSKMEYTFSGLRMYVSKNTLLEMQAEDDFYLARGIAWIQTQKPVTVRSKFGSVVIPSGGDFWVESNDSAIILKTMQSSAKVYPRGSKGLVFLPEGHEMQLGAVEFATGASSFSAPNVIQLHRHFGGLARVFPFQSLNLQEYTHNLGRVIVAAAEYNSTWLKGTVQRKVASEDSVEDRRKAEAIEAPRRHTYLRRLFLRKSNFED